MNEEILKPEEIKTPDDKEIELTSEKVNINENITEDVKTSSQEADITKIKIRHILAQRIKKCGFKKVLGIVLIALICFCGGILTDRFIMRHAIRRHFYGNPGIQRQMPGNFYGGRRFGGFGHNNVPVPPSYKIPSQNQPQSPVPNAQPKQ